MSEIRYFYLTILILTLSIRSLCMDEDARIISVVKGKGLIIKCRINNVQQKKDIKLQWSKDLFGLENSTLSEVYKNRLSVPTSIKSGIFDLHFKYTEVDDQGLYGCHVDITLEDGTMINTVEKTSLRIIVPPTTVALNPRKLSYQDPKNNMFLYNANTIWGLQNYSVALNCSPGSSNPVAKIMWTMTSDFRTTEIASNTKSDQTVTIKLTKQIDNSIITCNIRNKNDYLGENLPNANYTLKVLYLSKTYITNDDEKLEGQIREGEVVTFICKTETTKEASVYYSWYIRYSSQGSTDHHLVNDSTSNRITLKMTQKHHRGRLHCVLKSTIKTNDCDRKLNRNCELQLVEDFEETRPFDILYPPKIANPFENVTVTNIGEWITLSCNVDSNPPATTKWYKTNIGTTKNSRSINWYHQTEISNLIESLRMENIIISGSYHKFQIQNDLDFDIYICEAKSAMFQSAYKYVIVANEEETSIKTDRSVIKIQEGGSASLMCLVEGWPRPPLTSIKWYHSDSQVPLMFSERMYVVNKNQLMAVESKVYIKNVVNSDYGSYNCTASFGRKKVSKRIDLQPIKDPMFIFTIIGVLGFLFLIITVPFIVCISRKHYNQKKKKKAQIQKTVLPSPTIDSSLDNEMFFNRLNSLQGFHKDNSFNESVNMPSNRCFIFNNKHQMSRLTSGDSRNGPYEAMNSKGNDRSWDSGVGQDDALYRNNPLMSNTRGSRCISPFSTMASSNNSNEPLNQNNLITNRYWQPLASVELPNQQNTDNGSNRFSNTDQGSNFNGSVHSSFIPANLDGSMPMIASTGNQSFVCIPIEEYQQHIRLLKESSRGDSSVHSFSSASFTTNIDGSAFNRECKTFYANLPQPDNCNQNSLQNSKPQL